MGSGRRWQTPLWFETISKDGQYCQLSQYGQYYWITDGDLSVPHSLTYSYYITQFHTYARFNYSIDLGFHFSRVFYSS